MFSTASTAPPKLSVVIAGGGVAAMETALALRSLAGPRVAMRLVAPEPEFTYRPLSVGEPFARSRPTRHSLPELAAAAGAEFVQERVARVDGPRRCLRLASGEGLEYDALVLATGALARAADPRALTFGGSPSVPAVRDLLAALRGGTVHDVAFAVPAGASWPLPLYELAIMTAREVLGEGALDARFWLLSPEAAPLAAFGPTASNAIAALLERAGVRFVGSRRSTVFPGTVLAGAEGREHMVQRVVTLPVAEGRRIPGVPHDRAGFIPVDPFGRVPGLPDVYAAGDGTTFPIKQGGLATQQADVVAAAIAADAGADVRPEPFRPVLRGMLMTDAESLSLRHLIAGGGGDGEVAAHALWWPPAKIAGRFLAPYLHGQDEAEVVGARFSASQIEVHHPLDPPPSLHGQGQAPIELLGRDPAVV